MNKIILLIFTLAIVSCSTELKYHMTNHRFLSPETKGNFLNGDIGVAYQINQKVILATAYDYLIFNLPSRPNTQTALEGTSEFNLPITLGLLKRLDAYTLDQKFGFKFQFIGTPENERSRGWKASAAAEYGHEDSDSSNVVFTSGNSTRTYSTKVKLDNRAFHLIVGNRLSETNLIYLSLTHDYYEYEGTLSSNQFSPLILTGHSVNYGANLGFQLQSEEKRHPVTIKIEAGAMRAKLDKNNTRTAGTAGGVVNWGW